MLADPAIQDWELYNALLEFPGCAVITNHHRWFLGRVATHIPACYVSSPAERRR